VEEGKKIGGYGNELISDGCRILTHCNAGWLAFADYGTALSVVYHAHRSGKKIFVYADETRPRGQGARLTAWELLNEGVPFSIVADNAGAYLMSQGFVNIVLVGADRVAANGDVANKIGTLEKAIIAMEYGVPFYVAVPASTFDMNCSTGSDMIIEQREMEEVLYQVGRSGNGRMTKISVSAPGATAINPAFDVTPAHYITGFITDRGIIKPRTKDILHLIKENHPANPLNHTFGKQHGEKI
jgi:S-methyl-5-thioribose-1-phosphate isomerase